MLVVRESLEVDEARSFSKILWPSSPYEVWRAPPEGHWLRLPNHAGCPKLVASWTSVPCCCQVQDHRQKLKIPEGAKSRWNKHELPPSHGEGLGSLQSRLAYIRA